MGIEISGCFLKELDLIYKYAIFLVYKLFIRKESVRMRNVALYSILCLTVLFSLSCSVNNGILWDTKPMQYNVQKTTEGFDLNSQWDQGDWANAVPVELTQFMGEKPSHFPRTQVKMLYDTENVYVFFRVEDNYVRAVAQNFHDPVCNDSCVEFFFTPGRDISKGYFNMETNCGGMILLCHQTGRGENVQEVSEEDCKKIQLLKSMPKIVDPEINGPTTWTVKYAIPYSILKKYADVDIPAAGTQWRANFYKCADMTSHPHWLTWNKVKRPGPDFHVPEYFGILVFE